VRGKGSKLGEPCPKVRLSQDRLPIVIYPPWKARCGGRQQAGWALSGLLHTNVVRANVASRKCRFAQMSLNPEKCLKLSEKLSFKEKLWSSKKLTKHWTCLHQMGFINEHIKVEFFKRFNLIFLLRSFILYCLARVVFHVQLFDNLA
jgi:hypothetical protein